MTDLKDCPFCGGTAHIDYDTRISEVLIMCGNCGGRTYGIYSLEGTKSSRVIEMCVKQWNTRIAFGHDHTEFGVAILKSSEVSEFTKIGE